MDFAYTIIYVPDVDQALTFYEQAFGLERLFLHESGEYGELSTGQTKLAFASEGMMELNQLKLTKNTKEKPALALEVVFTSDHVEEAFKKACEAGAIAVHKPAEKPWGQTVAYLRDINGIMIAICTPMG